MERIGGTLGENFLCFLPSLLFTFFAYFSLSKGTPDAEFNNRSDFDYDRRPSTIAFEGGRFVHLDLKGAPPIISYYKDFFALLSRLGATGVLIEYEDMFPYTGELKVIPARNAYTQTDIITINNLATENNLTVIPLVQTFGHLEFLLKLKEFIFLREVPTSPQVICPKNNMTLTILYEMLQQIVQAHPKSTMIHIGADEVYHIGKCYRCQQIMYKQKLSEHQLFLSHIKNVATLIKTTYPSIKILMWDDVLRNIDLRDLQRSAISSLIEPVIWNYSENVTEALGYKLFNTYSKIFKALWFASAFKGASDISQYITPISHHVWNHLSWMEIYNKFKNKVPIGGIFITGWQRYNHFAVLCELLPVGIPSLAFSLSILLRFNTNGSSLDYPDVLNPDVVNVLNCKKPHALTELSTGSPACKYPGGDILDAIATFHEFTEKYMAFKEQARVASWNSNYNIHYKFPNPDHINSILGSLKSLLSELTSIDTNLTGTMLKVFDIYTVSEWKNTFFKPVYDDVKIMLVSANRLSSGTDWPRRLWYLRYYSIIIYLLFEYNFN